MLRLIAIIVFSMATFAPTVSAGPFRLFRPCRPCPIPNAAHCCPALTLRLKFQNGASFFVENTTLTKQKIKVMGQTIQQLQEQVIAFQLRPVKMAENGDWIVRVRIVRIAMNIEIGGNRIQNDTRERPSIRSPMTDFFDQIVKMEFTATFLQNGAIRHVDGLEFDINPQMVSVQQKLAKDMPKLLAPFGGFLPEAAVRPDNMWVTKDVADIGPISGFGRTTGYTLYGVSCNVCDIRFRSLVDPAPPQKAQPGLGFVVKKAEIRDRLHDGNVVYDAARGRLIEGSAITRIAGSLVVKVADVESGAELEHETTVRVRTLDSYR